MGIQLRQAKTIFLVLAILVFVLAGCGQSASSFGLEASPITATALTQSMRYIQGLNEGPSYTIGLTLPEDWVDSFVAFDTGNVVYFHYVNEEGQRFPIFTIEALSPEQFWQQQGSYPAQRVSLRTMPETYFVYHILEDAFHSGLPKAEFQVLAEQVPDVMTTFEVLN
jgi:hypothetical protein